MNRKTLSGTVVIVCVCAVMYGFGINPAYADEQSEKPHGNDIVWFDDLDEGLKAGQKQGKPVIVDFTSEQMLTPEYQVAFTSPTIAERLVSDWVCVRLHGKDWGKIVHYQGREMKYVELRKYFRLQTPALLFFDKNGDVVQAIDYRKVFVFYKDKEFLCFILDYMKDEAYTKDITFKEYLSMNEKGIK